MDHRDHVELLRPAVGAPGGTWADLGSGRGAFTLALADLLGPAATIHSLDRDPGALREQRSAMAAMFPDRDVRYHVADFTAALDLPPLDGLVMANSLHFHRHRVAVVRHVTRYLRPGGTFVLVEYDADRGNPWVPHPLSFATWQREATGLGLLDVRLTGRVASRFLGAIYSAAARTPGGVL